MNRSRRKLRRLDVGQVKDHGDDRPHVCYTPTLITPDALERAFAVWPPRGGPVNGEGAVSDLLILSILIAVSVSWFGVAFMAGYLAAEKGYSEGTWFLIALFFGALALLAAVGLPDRVAEEEEDEDDEGERRVYHRRAGA